MPLRWRYSGGIVFSLVLHSILLLVLFYHYPNALQSLIPNWVKWVPFMESRSEYMEEYANSWALNSAATKASLVIFPDIILQDPPLKLRSEDPSLKRNKQKQKKIIVKKKLKTQATIVKKVTDSQKSLKNILNQIEKYPVHLDPAKQSQKTLSFQIGSLLSGLIPVLPKVKFSAILFQDKLSAKALVQYRQELNAFLSERWEVPIHLMESKKTVIVKFNIEKDGRIINYVIDQLSEEVSLDESVRYLLKNLQLLPALPESYSKDSYNFGVRFTPEKFLN